MGLRGIISVVMVLILALFVAVVAGQRGEVIEGQYSMVEKVYAIQRIYHVKMMALRSLEFDLRHAEGETPSEKVDNALNRLIEEEGRIEKELEEMGYAADVWCGYVDPLTLKELREDHMMKGITMFDPSTKIIIPTEEGLVEVAPCKFVLRSDPRGFVNVGFTGMGNMYFEKEGYDPFLLKPAVGITVYDPVNDVYDMGMVYEVVE